MKIYTCVLFIVSLTLSAAVQESGLATEKMFSQGRGRVQAILNKPFDQKVSEGMSDLVVCKPGDHLKGKTSDNCSIVEGLINNLPRAGLPELQRFFEDVCGANLIWSPATYEDLTGPLDSLESKLRFLINVSDQMVAMALCLSFMKKAEDQDIDDRWAGFDEAKKTLVDSLGGLKRKLNLPDSVLVSGVPMFTWWQDGEVCSGSGVPGFEGLWSSEVTKEQRLLCAQITHAFSAPVDGFFHSTVVFDQLSPLWDPFKHILLRSLSVFYYHDFPVLLRRLADIGRVHFNTMNRHTVDWLNQLDSLYQGLQPDFCFHDASYSRLEPFKFLHLKGAFNQVSFGYHNQSEDPWLEVVKELGDVNPFEQYCLKEARRAWVVKDLTT